MRRTSLLGGLACVVVVLGGASCSNKADETKADLTDKISESLQGGVSGYTAKQADCVAAIVVDTAGFDALKDIDVSADEPPEALQDDIAATAPQAAEECDLSDGAG